MDRWSGLDPHLRLPSDAITTPQMTGKLEKTHRLSG